MSSFSRGGLLLSFLALACSSSEGGSVSLAPSLVFPEGLLDGVTSLKVSVYDPSGGALSCNAQNGSVTGLSNQKPLSSVDLSSMGCNTGVSFCGSLSVTKTSDTRLFAAQAFVGTSTTPVASGCTAQAPNQDNIEVMIKMLRTLPPQTCNGMPSSMLVQCSTGMAGDPVCDQNCQSIEELYSAPDNSSTGATAENVRPMLVWPPGSGPTSRLVGVWGEKKSAGTIAAMRTLDDSMEPNAQGSMCVMTSSFRIPESSAAPCPGQIYTLSQFNPTIADLNNDYLIAFEDTSTGTQSISLLTLNQSLQPTGPVNLSPSPAAAQSAPSMAVSGSNVFVAWDNGQGTIVGKMLTNGTTAGSLQTLGTGSNVTVAGTSSGWVASFLSGGDVDLVTIDATGKPGSSPMKVNSGSGASHPGVAAFGSNVAVIWADSGGNVFVQRYQNGTAIMGDSSNALQDPSLMGNQKEPSIAAGTNFFVATWVDGASGDVRARFLDGTGGYMFNLVNGQSSDFKASVFEQRTRDNPVAVVGGAGPYVAIAWEDNTGAPASYMGIWGRRFPLPQ